jgi:AcrR family transcriptional regulator
VRRDVLAATIDLLSQRGWGISIEDVAAAAGVHKTTVYRRWPTIGELVLDAVLEETDEHVAVPDTGDTRRDLTLFLEAVHRFVNSTTGRALMAATVHVETMPDIDDVHRRLYEQRISAAAQILHRGAARGDISLTTKPEILIEMLVAPVHFRLLVTKQRLGRATREAFVDVVMAVCSPS